MTDFNTEEKAHAALSLIDSEFQDIMLRVNNLREAVAKKAKEIEDKDLKILYLSSAFSIATGSYALEEIRKLKKNSVLMLQMAELQNNIINSLDQELDEIRNELPSDGSLKEKLTKYKPIMQELKNQIALKQKQMQEDAQKRDEDEARLRRLVGGIYG